MLQQNPEMQATAKKLRIASVLTTILLIACVSFAIYASNSCNAFCTDLYYFYECYSNGDLYCCSSIDCSGSCQLETTSCTGLSVAAGICGFFLLIAIIAMFVYACKLRAMQREALLNGSLAILIFTNQQPPQYNNNPVNYGNNQHNQPNQPSQPGQANPYQQGNNYVAPQYYNNQP